MEIEERIHQQFSIAMLTDGCNLMRKRPQSFNVEVKAKSEVSGNLILSLRKPMTALERIVNKIIDSLDSISMTITKINRTQVKIQWSVK